MYLKAHTQWLRNRKKKKTLVCKYLGVGGVLRCILNTLDVRNFVEYITRKLPAGGG